MSARFSVFGKVLEAVTATLQSLPDDVLVEFSAERGLDEIIFDEPSKHTYNAFSLNTGITITIKIDGGARDGYCTEAEADERKKKVTT